VGEALAYMQVNTVNGNVRCAAIKAPSFGDSRTEHLNNISVYTGSAIINGLNDNSTNDNWLGGAKRVIITASETIIYGGSGDPKDIKSRINQLKKSLNLAKIDHDAELYKTLLAGITGSIATIIIGGNSEVEIKEKRDRVDDALHAVYAAIKEGVIPGGGIALHRAAFMLLHSGDPIPELLTIKINSNIQASISAGRKILLNAALVPFNTIMSNCELNPDSIMSNILKEPNCSLNWGFNAKNLEYVDMIEKGIVDPFLVTRNALSNAASIAGIILTTDCLIAEKEYTESNFSTPMQGLLPGMM